MGAKMHHPQKIIPQISGPKAAFPISAVSAAIRMSLGSIVLVLIAYASASLNEQLLASAMVILLMETISLIWRDHPERRGYEVMRNAMIFISLVMSLRYLIWRGTETLPFALGGTAIVAGLLLFAAECYSFVVSFLGNLPNLRKKNRTPQPLPDDPALLPMIDVYIPTYSEDPELVRTTIIAATQMRYPADKFRVYVLDDGGTAQMRSNADPARASANRQRAERIKAIAQQFGAHYLTRERNEHAKAGNLNHALNHTRGEFIVALDCDHIPAAEFIEKTLGFFLQEPKLFLVQTPHHLINPDPLERNLSTFSRSPSENDMFFSEIQPGLDAWGASFFCGSAAMLRRSVIDDIGGFSQETVTEDAETTLRALSRGYTTAFLNQPLVSGLQPETFSDFIQQRARWGQGMLQIFMFQNPWAQPGLTLMQRILFTNFALFWGFPIVRLIFLSMPLLSLMFYVQLADASVTDVLSYCIPALVCSAMTTQFIFGKVRWPFISHLYEVIQSVHLTLSLIHLLRNPHAPKFKVTPKGEILEKDFVSMLARPFYWLLALSLSALSIGAVRFYIDPASRSMIAFVAFWALLDLVFLLCALGVTFERRQQRIYPRAPVDYPVELHTDLDLTLRGTLVNASATSAGIRLAIADGLLSQLKQANTIALQIDGVQQPLTALLQKAKPLATAEVLLGLTYRFESIDQERAAVAIAYGSAAQLEKNQQRRQQRRSALSTFILLLQKAFTRGGGHMLLATRRKINQGKLSPALIAQEKK